MHDQKTVSIIIPVYRVEAYLDRCVESACKQTYPHLQIILVDDGSPDDCPRMCDSWAARDSRIQVIHQENGGLSHARNAGLAAATGDYIYFLDSDDYVEPDLVETALAYMEEGVDAVAFSYFCHRTDGSVNTRNFHATSYLLPEGNARADFVLDVVLQYKVGWEAWNRLYRRENIQKYGLRFADNREIFAEDLHFFLCYCAHARQVVCISQALYHYMLRDDSIMGKAGKQLNVGRMNRLAMGVKAYYEGCGDCQELLAAFPEIHYYIITQVLERARRAGLLSGRDGRKKLLADVDAPEFFRENIRCVLKDHSRLKKNGRESDLADRLSYLRYVLDGCYPALALRSRYLNRRSKRGDKRTPEA